MYELKMCGILKLMVSLKWVKCLENINVCICLIISSVIIYKKVTKSYLKLNDSLIIKKFISHITYHIPYN